MTNSIRVIGEYVTLKVKDMAGSPVLVGYLKGAVVENVDAASLKHHLDAGLVEQVGSEKALFEPVGGEGMFAAPLDVTTEPSPADNAPKPEWVEYAVRQGATREDAEGSTKADLIAAYGNK